jgi:hypothetical protein
VPATADRADIMHTAGFLRLSPALRDGAPALVAAGEAGVARCGWEPFFRALDARRLAVAWEPGDPASVRLVPRAAAPPARRSPEGGALAEARRFLRAWRGGSV